jgi:hypothetical protein
VSSAASTNALRMCLQSSCLNWLSRHAHCAAFTRHSLVNLKPTLYPWMTASTTNTVSGATGARTSKLCTSRPAISVNLSPTAIACILAMVSPGGQRGGGDPPGAASASAATTGEGCPMKIRATSAPSSATKRAGARGTRRDERMGGDRFDMTVLQQEVLKASLCRARACCVWRGRW